MQPNRLAEKIEFNQEEEFFSLGLASQEKGPVSSFKPVNKAETKATALETGHIEGNFQYCGPFADSQQKTIRQELTRVKGIINIFGDTLTTDDIEGLKPTEQALRLYADRVMHEAVLVEGARRAALAERGEGSDDIEFCKRMMAESMGELYPTAERELALDALGLFHSRLERLMNDDRTSGFVHETLAKYPFLSEAAGREPPALTKEKQEEVQRYLKDRFDPVFTQVREEIGDIDNGNMTQAAKRVMELFGYIDEGWSIDYVGDERVGFYVDPANKKVEVGDRTKPITWAAFEKLMVHEVGVHVTRAATAYAHGHNLAAAGWTDYETAEEGLAILEEKSWTGKASEAGTIDRDHYRYIIGSYASGALDGQYHNADDSYEMAIRMSMISNMSTQLKKGENVDLAEAETKARSAVFEHTFRFYRGMPDGLVMIKDIIYFQGYVKMVKFLNESDRPVKEVLDEFNRGKYNPFIPLQVKAIDGLYDKSD
jgi:hypothetical protein